MSVLLFVDTNILLSFYASTRDDANQLEALIALVSSKAVKLILTAHVEREWFRNRESKIHSAMSEFEKFSLKEPSIPRFMNAYQETKELKRHLFAARSAHKAVLERAKMEASTVATNADILINKLIHISGIASDSENIIARAEHRLKLGEPPGKDDSLGDRINWETILAYSEHGSDLHIISSALTHSEGSHWA